jgi:hypothetical protein
MLPGRVTGEGRRQATGHGALARARDALVRGDTRTARSLARAALADPREDPQAARDLLRRTGPDPLALWLAAAVLVVLAAAALFGLFHGPGR